jgi:hypothetical protein
MTARNEVNHFVLMNNVSSNFLTHQKGQGIERSLCTVVACRDLAPEISGDQSTKISKNFFP